MDPLSITASIVATLQAAGAAAKVVESAWKLRHVSRDFVILRNEVCVDATVSTLANRCELNDLQCLLLQIKDIVLDQDEQHNPSTASIGHHVERLRGYLEELEEIVSNLTKTQGAGESHVAVSYPRWIRTKNRISSLRSNLVEARNNLSLAINAFLVVQNKQMYRMLLHVQEFEITGSPIPRQQAIEHPVEATVRENADESSNASESEAWVDAPDALPTMSLVTQERLTPTFEVWQSRLLGVNDHETHFFHIAGTLGTTKCDYLCACRCHIRTPLETPRWLRDLCGYLFISHIAIPWLSRCCCSLPTCKQSDHGALRVSYVFPSWLMRRMLILSMTWQDISGPGASWTIQMPRIVPYYAPIWESIRFNRGLAVRELLKSFRCSPFDIRHDGTTLLYHAFCFRRWDIARFVLSQGGSMDWEDAYGRTPLSVAMVAHHSLESTPETKAEAYKFISRSDIAERLGFTSLHVAILQNSPEELHNYLRIDLTHLNAQDNLGRTPLILASCHSNDQAARRLLQFGADPTITDRSMRSPLHFAAQRAPRIVQAFMEMCHGEQLSRLIETTDERGRNALYFAIEFNQAENFAYLCAHGLRLDVKDNLQRTIIHYAAWTGEAEVMDVLSQQDLSAIDLMALDSYGRTPEECFTSLRHDVRVETTEAFQRLLVAASR